MAHAGPSDAPSLPLYSPRELARLTDHGVHFRRIIRAVEAGELRAINVASGEERAHWRIAWPDFVDWLNRRANVRRRDPIESAREAARREAAL